MAVLPESMEQIDPENPAESLKILDEYIHPQVIDPEVIALMKTPAILSDGTAAEYCGGLMTHKLHGLDVFGHGGADAAYRGQVSCIPEKELEVISEVSEDKKAAIRDYLQTVPISIQHIEQGHVFDIIVTERSGDSYAKVRIADFHTNICLIEKNGRVLYEKPLLNEEARRDSRVDRSLLNMKDIWDFAETADLQDVADLLERQIRYNNAIAEEGLLGDYGANIGRVLLSTYGNDVSIRAKAKAAAGSDARMNGCELPVIINSGSGNQGITCSVPLIEYAKELHSGKEKLYRALIISNLVAIHEKTGIGTLSAYCGAVSAGAGAGAGIVYLCGDGYQAAIHTVVNALAIVSGIVCDGAKASCAAKISAAVDAAILGHDMAMQGRGFRAGEGLIQDTVEQTIASMGYVGRVGMKDTDIEILNIMIGKTQVC